MCGHMYITVVMCTAHVYSTCTFEGTVCIHVPSHDMSNHHAVNITLTSRKPRLGWPLTRPIYIYASYIKYYNICIIYTCMCTVGYVGSTYMCTWYMYMYMWYPLKTCDMIYKIMYSILYISSAGWKDWSDCIFRLFLILH